MKKKIDWSIIIPILLVGYLGLMIYLGWDSYKCGATSPLLYFGGTAIALLCIILLHFHLKRTQGRKKR